MREKAEKEKAKLLEDQDWMLGQSTIVPKRVQTTYQAQITTLTAMQIKRLK